MNTFARTHRGKRKAHRKRGSKLKQRPTSELDFLEIDEAGQVVKREEVVLNISKQMYLTQWCLLILWPAVSWASPNGGCIVLPAVTSGEGSSSGSAVVGSVCSPGLFQSLGMEQHVISSLSTGQVGSHVDTSPFCSVSLPVSVFLRNNFSSWLCHLTWFSLPAFSDDLSAALSC